MNLIEKLGGYEKAKKLLGMFGILRTEFIDGVYKKDLQDAIADHERTDHVDFKVGDKVVFEANFCDEHKGLGYGEITYCTMDKRVFEIDNYYLISIDEIRHDTDEDIHAGLRL